MALQLVSVDLARHIVLIKKSKVLKMHARKKVAQRRGKRRREEEANSSFLSVHLSVKFSWSRIQYFEEKEEEKEEAGAGVVDLRLGFVAPRGPAFFRSPSIFVCTYVWVLWSADLCLFLFFFFYFVACSTPLLPLLGQNKK